MHKRRILFVLGAGASHEVRMPIGADLKNEIATRINIRFQDGYNQSTGDKKVMEAITRHCNEFGEDANDYLRKAWQISAALPQALSIDNYIDAHRGDKCVELIAKLGIARSILEAERRSTIFNHDHNKPFAFDTISGTWYHTFLQLLTERVSKQEVANIFENIAFIDFNYDRCLEHFLPIAIANYYGIPASEANKAVSGLQILHPYGTIGRLPWRSTVNDSVSYGADQSVNLLQAVNSLKTFTERIEDPDALKKIRSSVQSAEIIVFLGFAFHSQNMELLSVARKSSVRSIFATAFKMSKNDCKVIEKQIQKTVGVTLDSDALHLRPDLKCSGLLTEYWRSLSSSY